MKVLVLEDSIYRSKYFIEKYGYHDLTIVENAYMAIDLLDSELFDYIFLDNDLGTDNGEGLYVARFLSNNENNPNNNSTIIIHSWNNVAVKEMLNYLPNAITVSFGSSEFYNIDLSDLPLS